MTTTETIDQLAELARIYRSILRHEDDKLSVYLNQDLQRVESISLQESELIEAVRRIHDRIRLESTGEAPSSTLDSRDRVVLERHLFELNGTIRELQLALQRSRRFVQHSLLHSQGLLAALFNDQHRGYNGKGDLCAGQGSLRRGMRA